MNSLMCGFPVFRLEFRWFEDLTSFGPAKDDVVDDTATVLALDSAMVRVYDSGLQIL